MFCRSDHVPTLAGCSFELVSAVVAPAPPASLGLLPLVAAVAPVAPVAAVAAFRAVVAGGPVAVAGQTHAQIAVAAPVVAELPH